MLLCAALSIAGTTLGACARASALEAIREQPTPTLTPRPAALGQLGRDELGVVQGGIEHVPRHGDAVLTGKP